MARRRRIIRKTALLVQQDEEHPLFQLSLTGDELLSVADISRVSRNNAGKLIGYQRNAVRRHIQSIVDYLNCDQVLFPNSIILALSSEVTFRRRRGRDLKGDVGTLSIPVPSNGGSKPAWIVDGQQRALAIAKSRRKHLPVPVNAFLAREVSVQRDQFLRVNNTKPLPRGLITELLPQVDTLLPPTLAARKIPSALADLLNQHEESPFFRLVRRASHQRTPTAVVSDTSLVQMLEESISSPSGCLFPYRNLATDETDFEGIQAVLFTYWSAVRACFPDAWGKPPAKSRLMHGAGIKSMGRLMDRVMGHRDPRRRETRRRVLRDLELVAPYCHWTDGRWADLGDLRWNDVQNVPRHVRILSNYLVRTYVEAKGAAK